MARGMCAKCKVKPCHRALTGKKTEHSYCYECLLTYNREREALRSPRDRTKEFRNLTLKKYGLTHKQFKKLLKAQGGGCAICGKKEHAKISLHVDHDHETGKVRGILCSGCNRGMGYFDRGFFQQAQTYLAKQVPAAIRKKF